MLCGNFAVGMGRGSWHARWVESLVMLGIMSHNISYKESGQTSGSIFSHSISRRGQTFILAASLAVLLFVSPKVWAQGTVRYDLVDLVDTTPGQDLWEYSYFLNGFTFQTNQGFSIFFDYQTFANLTNARPSLNPGWSIIAVQPDVFLHGDGFLDGMAQINSPAYTGPFQVVVTWKGQGTPGAQLFNTYSLNPFTTTSTGTTTNVPEPQSILLTSLGLLLLVGVKSLRNIRPLS